MARESVFDVDLGLDDAVKQLDRSRDLVREIGEANSKNLDITDKVKNQYKEINDSLTKQRLEMARMSADFAEQLKAMQVSGLSQDEINAAKQKFQNEKDIAKLAEESLAKQRQALSDKSRIELLNEDKLHRKRILHFKEIGKLAGGLWDIAKYATGAAIGVAATGSLGGVAFGTMASSGGEERKRAMGLGVSVPEMQALRHVYKSIYDDPESTLSRIYGMQRDPKQATDLSRLLKNNPRFDTAKEISQASSFELASILPTEIKKRLDQIDKLTGGNKFLQSSYYPMFGLGDFSQSDLSRIGKLSYKELASEQRSIPSALARENISDKTLLQWQQAQEKFGLSGQAIENTFLTTLTKLAPQLGKLSEGITDVIKAVGKSNVVSTAIDKTANALGRFTKYLDSGEAKEEITGFLESLDIGAGYVYSFADGIGVAGRAMGLLDERSLKGSEYRKISAISMLNPEFGKLLREAEENPSNVLARNKAIHEFSFFSQPAKNAILAAAGGSFSDVFKGKEEYRSIIGKLGVYGVRGLIDEQIEDFKNFLHTDKSGIIAKKGAFAGGHIKQSTIDVMGAIQGIKGFSRFTAADDGSHAHSKTGGHPEGRAFDFTINDPSQSASIANQVRKALKGTGAYVQDEYLHPSKSSTGKHIHVSLPKSFDKLLLKSTENGYKATPIQHPQPKPRPQVVSVKVDINAGFGMDAAAQMQRVR